jgi:hypothetical protein
MLRFGEMKCSHKPFLKLVQDRIFLYVLLAEIEPFLAHISTRRAYKNILS